MGGAKAHYDGIVAFSQTDFTEDLKKITVPVLVIHSEDDQIVPYVAAGPLSAKLLKNGTLKTYKASRTACQQRMPRRSMPTCSPSSRGNLFHGARQCTRDCAREPEPQDGWSCWRWYGSI